MPAVAGAHPASCSAIRDPPAMPGAAQAEESRMSRPPGSGESAQEWADGRLPRAECRAREEAIAALKRRLDRSIGHAFRRIDDVIVLPPSHRGHREGIQRAAEDAATNVVSMSCPRASAGAGTRSNLRLNLRDARWDVA